MSAHPFAELPAQLWLLRAGQLASALEGSTPNPEQTYTFNVPSSRLRHGAAATREAARSEPVGRAEKR